MLIFDHHRPKIVKVTFSFHKFVSTNQKSIYFIYFPLTYSQFWSPENKVATPIFDHAATKIFFNQLLFSMNMYEHAYDQAFSPFCSRDIVDLKIL